MKNFIIHDSLGQILRTGSCPDSMVVDQLQPGETAIEGTANDVTQYIVSGVVTNKPALGSTIDKTTIIGNGVDAATISGLPNPTAVSVVGGGATTQATVIDGTLALTLNLAGNYKVTLRAVNKLTQEYTINAT